VGSQVYLYPHQGKNASRISSRVLGWQEGKFLLLAMPYEGRKPVSLEAGTQVVLRYVLSGEIYGLRTRVLRPQLQPVPLLFLAFPKEIENVPLRSQERVGVRLPSVMAWVPGGQMPEGITNGFLVDVTPDGALLELRLPSAINPRGKSLQVSFLLGPDEVIKVNATVRNVSRNGDLCQLGVAFIWTDPADQDRVVTFCRMHGV